jgi:ABC-type dipeptide/oligopeptide/nickel transport system permease component
MSNLAVFTIRRLLAMMIILYTVATLVFLLAHASPADPATMLLDQQATNQQARLSLRHAFGLDQPLWQQYVQYLSGAVHGTFGMSEAPGTFQQPVTTLLNERVPTTLKLGGMALLLALLVGLPIGFLSALKPNSRTDHGSQLSMMVLYALPIIVVAPIAQLIFGVELRWLPVAGWGAPGWLGIREMILPVSTYGLGIAGYFSQSFRSILLEVLHHDYIRTARAKGVKEWLVVLRHAGKNTLVPLASIVGPTLGHLIVGAFIIEFYFSIPGVGLVTLTSVVNGDAPVIEATAVLLAASVVIVNALTDIVCAMVDPRVEL